MKKPLLFGIILTVCVVIVAFVFALGYPEGMISYWKFEEGEGTTASDSVDENHGTLVNGPGWTTGQVGGALSFDGVNDYVKIDDDDSLSTSEGVTVEAWIKADSFPGNYQMVVGKWNGGIREYEIQIWYRKVFFFASYGGASYNWAESLTELSPSTWYHIAGVFDDINDELRVYINGAQDGVPTAFSGPIPNSNSYLTIGAQFWSSLWRLFDGVIDEVAIYNRTLSVEEINQHYENGLIGSGYEVECVSPASGMVSWWPGDENADDIWDANHGTLWNGATCAAGRVDQAFSFDGVDDYVDVGDIGVTGDWTIDFWTKLYTVAPRIQYPIGLSTRLSPHSGSGVFIAFTDESNTWGLYDGNQNWQKPYVHSVFGSPVSADVWYHIAVIKSGTTYTLYLDGNYENSKSILDDIDITNLQIGRRLDPSGGFGYFNGLIDEVEIFNRALSQSEIQAIYLAGSAGKCKNEPPVAVCKDIEIHADENCQASIVPEDVDGGSYDPDEGDPITLSIDNIGPFALGTHDVNLTVTDESGESDTCQATVTVIDTTPPNIESLGASPNVLWPPNHKMVAVNLSTSVSDNCDLEPECQIITVRSNEPENGLGDGDKAPDWEITGALTVNLRAERSGTGSGRVYTITVTCTDAYENSSTETVNVTVPHDKGKKKK